MEEYLLVHSSKLPHSAGCGYRQKVYFKYFLGAIHAKVQGKRRTTSSVLNV